MMDSDRIYRIAVSMTPGVTADMVRLMDTNGVEPGMFVTGRMSELTGMLGDAFRISDEVRGEALFRARKEAEFIARHSIKAIYLTDDDYPPLLREIPDAPIVIYVLGNADLNTQPSLNVVGTRKCTTYGTSFCAKMIEEFAGYIPRALVVSGLAYGIDAAGHIAALERGLTTVAVVAHGLDMIYPAQHRDLARRIIASGGAIVSEYPSGVRPFRNNFLQRNRIVAGLCELTFVVESEVRGGAMSTANQAFSYSREVMALPGRCSDVKSSGCNMLIARQKASIFTSVADMIRLMGWKIPALGTGLGNLHAERQLFPELDGDAAVVYDCVRAASVPVSVDEVHMATSLPMPSLMAALTDLEFEGVVTKLPGARYEIC